jgi:epoxyqueuosine reductase
MGEGREVTVVTASLEGLIKAQAFGLGFDLAGITTLGPAQTMEAFEEWLSRGYAGEMSYLSRGAEKRRDTRLPYAAASSAVVVGLNYGGTAPSGPVARYARGDDYHEVMVEKLDSLHLWIEAQLGREIAGKSYVDTGPILERDLAHKAGLGWFGKNTNLINPGIGSFFFLGTLVLDLELEADSPFESDRCGTCTRCLDACPTDAFVGPHVLDTTKCISYLTIESRNGIPEELRESVGTLIYGCDICQEVCPWNVKFSRDASEPTLAARKFITDRDVRSLALELVALNDESFREKFRGSPMKRAKRSGLARNAAVVLGNIGDADDSAALEAALESSDAITREHNAWAIGRIERRSMG